MDATDFCLWCKPHWTTLKNLCVCARACVCQVLRQECQVWRLVYSVISEHKNNFLLISIYNIFKGSAVCNLKEEKTHMFNDFSSIIKWFPYSSMHKAMADPMV